MCKIAWLEAAKPACQREPETNRSMIHHLTDVAKLWHGAVRIFKISKSGSDGWWPMTDDDDKISEKVTLFKNFKYLTSIMYLQSESKRLIIRWQAGTS